MWSSLQAPSISLVSKALLTIVLLGALEAPEWLCLILDTPIPWIRQYMPYSMPLVAAVIVFNWALQRRIYGGIRVHLFGLLFATFVCVLAVMAVIHSSHEGTELRLWLVTGFFWMFVFYVAVRSFEYLPDARQQIASLALFIVLAICVTQFVGAWLLMGTLGFALPFLAERHFQHSPYIAYLAVFAIALIWFEMPWKTAGGKWAAYLLLVPLVVFIMYQQRNTGSLVILVVLIAIKVLTWLPMHFQRSVRFNIGLAGAAVLAASIPVLMQSSDPTLEGLHVPSISYDEYRNLHGDVVSSYIRRETIKEQLRLFSQSPIFGVGLSRASDIRVLTLGMHSNLLYVLVTTGLLGFGFMAIWLIYGLFISWKDRGYAALAVPSVMFAMMLLSTETNWWWAIVVFLIGNRLPMGERARAPSGELSPATGPAVPT